jgi:hypothetical protein
MAHGEERLACFRNITVEFKLLLEFEGIGDGGIGHSEENSKRFGGNFGNLLVKVADFLISASRKPEIRSSQNSV